MGTACHVRRSARIVQDLRKKLGIRAGETTTDNKFTLHTVNCLGACALGPVIVVNGEYYGQVTPEKLKEILSKYMED
jgi:NADH-quinone oxidoreductase subunit E